ncbi:MAG: pyruvate ferredoxin oxidoreductase [Jatrophihabitans sp.]|uniref:pyruvate ferredoxin oxidoreductase n=1 Tax=Jatrophihabitans sp. TaxID=1932789 RepID=UPI003F81B88B
MREQIEGSRAIARTVARCRPSVVPAYPITPQTHIVEALLTMIRAGELPACRAMTVESEFAAMSAAIGAAAAGVRTYTATASQGLLYMAEALFNASGLGMPIVMTVANRAIGAPINIWNDHSDAMSQRDCGWVQLYAQDNQQAVDLHAVAFALAERLSVPVMVCVDGFVLTHAVEPIELPDQAVVDAFLPALLPGQRLDPDEPMTIGAMVGPEAFTEVRWLADWNLRRAVEEFTALTTRWWSLTGRANHAITPHRVEGAHTVLVTLGSISGTVAQVLEDEPGLGHLVIGLYRPFPADAVRTVLRDAERVVVLERALAPGAGGPVSADVRDALAGLPVTVSTVVAGLGGRPVTSASVRRLVDDLRAGTLPARSFLDLHGDVVARERRRAAELTS